MPLTLDIPDEILQTIKIPRTQINTELKKELAFLMYQRGFTSMGTARRFASLSKWAFIEGLTERGIPRHYGEHELEEDIRYAKSCQ